MGSPFHFSKLRIGQGQEEEAGGRKRWGPWEPSGVTPDLGDGAKVKARVPGQISLGCFKTFPPLSGPQNVSPPPGQCRRQALGLGASAWCPGSLKIPLTGLKVLGKCPHLEFWVPGE